MLKLYNYFYYIILMNIDIIKLLYLSCMSLSKFCYINLYYEYYNKSKNSIEYYNYSRFKLIKELSVKLCNLNVNYLKIIQSLCLQKDFLTKQEQEYLIKYTNNVPYTFNDIDFNIINFLKNQNIIFDSDIPINSGVSALVYKGKYNNNNVAIKILKKNAKINMYNCLSTLKILIYVTSFIPIIKNLNLISVFELNKKIMLEQLDFINEKSNLRYFIDSYQNYDYINIPKLYEINCDMILNNNTNLTCYNDKYNSKFLIMEYIDGFTIQNLIEIKNNKLNKIFGEKILKFGLLAIIMTSCIHCDLHPGNFILNIKDISNNKILNNNEINNIFSDLEHIIDYDNYEYILNIIDFGLAIFPSKETQNIYYEYFNKIFVENDYVNGAEYSLNNLIENMDGNKSQQSKNFKNAKNDLSELFKKYDSRDYDLEIFYKINKIINNYGFKFKNDILKIQISLAVSCHMTKNLLGIHGINKTTKNLMRELFSIKNLINFD
jgi:predicted unusual protein kinase regulating ubiquinone biosynthesis (AarF/ABC1/UbiB family)